MSRLRSALPWLLALAVLVAGVAWFLATHERVSKSIPLPPRGEASFNPLYALKLALRADGQRVESRQRLPLDEMALAAGDTLLVYSDPRGLTSAQLEALYGLPSWVGPDSIGARMVKYVWTPSGQLAPQQEEPCSGANYLGYSFDNDRKPVAPPECSAVFTMSHETKAGQSTVRFSLIDFDLARQDLEETDRQILEQISDEGVQPSDMKL